MKGITSKDLQEIIEQIKEEALQGGIDLDNIADTENYDSNKFNIGYFLGQKDILELIINEELTEYSSMNISIKNTNIKELEIIL